MEKIDIDLIHRYFSGKAKPEEAERLEQWMTESKENRDYLNQLRWIWEESAKASETELENYSPDVEAALKNLHVKIDRSNKIKTKTLRKRMSWIGIAATFLLILSVWQGSMLLSGSNKLYYSTKSGEHKEVLLPDNSKVWLAENSELTFLNNKRDRKTTLKGEGYFEIAKDAERPFTIEGYSSGITVVGTKFNFKSMINEPQEAVYVSEGIVNFYNLENEDEHITLTEGELGTYSKSTNTLLENESTNKNISTWATGHLQFEDTKMSEALKDIENFYDVNIDLENDQLLNCSLTTDFLNEDLSVVFETIELIFQTEIIKKDDANYIFKNGGCN